jgi:hypothetical protein
MLAPEVGADDLRVCEVVGGSAPSENPATAEDDGLLTSATYQVDVMLYEQHSRSRGASCNVDRLEQGVTTRGVEAGRRLVEQQDPRLCREGATHVHQSTSTEWQVPNRLVGHTAQAKYF